MKRSLLALGLYLSLALNSNVGLGAPQAALSETAPMLQVGAKAEPCVRLRAGASTERRILDCLEPGTRLKVLGRISGWSHIHLLDGTEGWIAEGFLEEVAGLPSAQPLVASLTRAESAGDTSSQIAALEGQLLAAANRYRATEERLRRTVEAAESAQRGAEQLRRQVEQLQAAAGEGDRSGRSVTEIAADSVRIRELEAALRAAQEANAAQAARVEELEAALPAGRDREAKLREDLAAAEERARAAEEANARLADRIAQLEAAPPPDSPRKADLKRQLKEVKSELRAAREATARQADRIAQLEADIPTARGAEADSRQALEAAELRVAEQAKRIEVLTGKLADLELRLAEAALKGPLADGGEPEPAERLVKVRSPIVSAPEPPKVAVRMPTSMAEEASAPAEEPVETAPPATEAAINAVRAWAAAWSDQRVDDYLSFYAAGFQPPNGLSRDVWEAQRRRRLRAPGYIRVTISSLDAVLLDDGSIRASFGQEYESDTFADSVTKVLTLAAMDGTWRIFDEQSTPRR